MLVGGGYFIQINTRSANNAPINIPSIKAIFNLSFMFLSVTFY